MKKTFYILSAAAIAAVTFAAPAAQARDYHQRDGGVSLYIGEHGAGVRISKDRDHYDGHRGPGYGHRGPGARRHLAKERRDVRLARRALRQEQRQLDRALASGRRGWIRAERRDVRQAQRRLRRELADLRG